MADRSRFDAGAWVFAGLLSLGAFVTVAAAGSTVAEVYPLRLAGLAVAAAALGAVVFAPLGLATLVVRAMRARGWTLRPSTVAPSVVGLCAIGWVVGLQTMGPVPVKTLLLERGTWLADALLGRGPFGPAALPEVRRRLDAAKDARRLADAAGGWCDAWAASFGAGLAAELAENRPAAFAETLGRLSSRHGVEAAAPVPAGTAGRALIADLSDVIFATYVDVDLPELAAIDATPAEVHRREIAFVTTGWSAAYEDGAWRLCPGTTEEARAQGVLHARALKAEALRVPTPTGAAQGPWDAEVRALLQRAALGHQVWLTGSTSVAADWPDALTRSAAATQAEWIRGFCTPAAAPDPQRSTGLAGVAQRWSVPPVGQALDPANRTLLEAQGRRYLGEIVAACAPVSGDRQIREAAAGLDVAETQRARWAELEARRLAAAARLADDGAGGVTIEFDGRSMRAVLEDGSWRIDWRD